MARRTGADPRRGHEIALRADGRTLVQAEMGATCPFRRSSAAGRGQICNLDSDCGDIELMPRRVGGGRARRGQRAANTSIALQSTMGDTSKAEAFAARSAVGREELSGAAKGCTGAHSQWDRFPPWWCTG